MAMLSSWSDRQRRIARAAGAAVAVLLLWLFVWPTALGGSMTYITVAGPSMEPAMSSGDFVIAREQASYETGDIVVFRTGTGDVIHRIIGGDPDTGYLMQGDANPDPDTWQPTSSDVLGEAVITVPEVGDHILLARQVLLTPPFPYLLAGFIFLTIVLGRDNKKTQTQNDDTGHADTGHDDEAADQPQLVNA